MLILRNKGIIEINKMVSFVPFCIVIHFIFKFFYFLLTCPQYCHAIISRKLSIVQFILSIKNGEK